MRKALQCSAIWWAKSDSNWVTHGTHRIYMLIHKVQHNSTHCSTLQHTATYWNTLQRPATPCNILTCSAVIGTSGLAARTVYTCAHTHYNTCNTLQHTATHCNTLQHTATHCNTLQHTATHCNTLQHTATHCNTLRGPPTAGTSELMALIVRMYTHTLQHTATHCNTLQHTATHCHTLQHTQRCSRCWNESTRGIHRFGICSLACSKSILTDALLPTKLCVAHFCLTLDSSTCVVVHV